MPYFIALRDAATEQSSFTSSISDRITLNCGTHCLTVEWSSPARFYKVRRPPLGFEGCLEVWLIVDGYPALPSEHRAISANQALSRTGDVFRPEREIESYPEAPADAMSCFTSVLIAPHEGIVEAQRDWLGGRTAYWHHNQGSFAISTSSARLFARCEPGGGENPDFMADFFSKKSARQGISAFSGINEILPGESLRYRNWRLERKQSRASPSNINFDPKDPISQFRELFFSAVKAALPDGERPAIMLSGGMDSAPVAAVAAKLAGNQTSRPLVVSWQLNSFPEADEGRWIRSIADFLELDRNIYDASHLQPFSTLETRYISPDFPVFNPFRPLILEAYRRAQSGGVDVILNASGGDMLYPHPDWRLYDRITRGDFPGVAETVKNAFRGRSGPARSARRQIRHLTGRLVRGTRLPKRQPPEWLTLHGKAHFERKRRISAEAHKYRHPLYADQLLNSAHGTALENTFSNRYGLDRRDPFQHPGLVSLMLQMPFSLSYGEGMTKRIIRLAMEGLLPDEIRLKARTGLLHSFYMAGFERNKPLIRDFLLAGDPEWTTWVRKDFVERTLACNKTPIPDQLLIANCIGYSLWKQALAEEMENGPR